MSAIFVVLVLAAIVFFIVVGCKLYKKRLSRERAQNKRLEQEVLNMQSQVTMIHGQMIGRHRHSTMVQCSNVPYVLVMTTMSARAVYLQ